MLLAALIAADLARIAITLLGGNPVTPLPSRAALPLVNRHPPADLQAIVAAHLFGVATLAPNGQNLANAPQTSANLILAGTIATQDPKHGIAIIGAGGPSRVYAVGDAVGGATLFAVYLERVILNRGGVLETLNLPQSVLTGQATVAQQMSGAQARTAATINNIRRMVQQNPGILNSVLRAVPSYDSQAGRLRGFRIYPGTNRAAFNGLGLRPGDLVTAIDGTPLDDPQRSQEVFSTIETSSQAVVTIERNGNTKDLTLNIAQVAAEANKDLMPPAGGRPQPLRARPNFANPNLNR